MSFVPPPKKPPCLPQLALLVLFPPSLVFYLARYWWAKRGAR